MKYIILLFGAIYKIEVGNNIITQERLEKHSLLWENKTVISQKEFDFLIDNPLSEIFINKDDCK